MFAPLDFAGPAPFNDWFAPDTTQRQQLGLKVEAVDPFWGLGEFIYLKSNDAVLKGSLVIWNGTYQAVLAPSTAGQGFPVAVAMAPAASGTYFWAQISGRCIYKTNATVAADTAVAIAAAGIVGTLANGKQVNNCRNLVAATGTRTLTVSTTNGTGVLTSGGYDGFFLGLSITGTGIPASTVVAKLDPDGRTIYTGSAIGTLGDKNSTATGTITLTGTFTGFGEGMIMYPFAQGQVA